jgi:hypothetical protein
MKTRDRYLAPLTTVALDWGISRESLLRAVFNRAIYGEQKFGRWFVDTRDKDKAAEVRRSIVAWRAARARSKASEPVTAA